MNFSSLLVLMGLLLAPVAEARRGSGPVGIAMPFQTTVGVAQQAARISRLRAQQVFSDRIAGSQGVIGADGFFDVSGFGGFTGGLGGVRGPVGIATPFQTTVGVAQQAARISRLRAQQVFSDRIAASQGVIGASGFFDVSGFGGFTDGLGGAGPALSDIRQPVRSQSVPRMHIVTVTRSEILPGQVQIIRGTSAEIVQVQ